MHLLPAGTIYMYMYIIIYQYVHVCLYACYVHTCTCIFVRCVCAQLRAAMEEGLVSQKAALQFMGQRFRVKAELPDWVPDEIVTKQLLRCI